MTLAQFKHIYGERPVGNCYAPGAYARALNTRWYPNRRGADEGIKATADSFWGARPVLRVRIKEWKA